MTGDPKHYDSGPVDLPSDAKIRASIEYHRGISVFRKSNTMLPIVTYVALCEAAVLMREQTQDAGIIAKTLEAIDSRCLAADGPVTPTLSEASVGELRVIYRSAKRIAERVRKADGVFITTQWLRDLSRVPATAMEIELNSLVSSMRNELNQRNESGAADPNAPWLTEAHLLCAENGIPPGRIEDRIKALREAMRAYKNAPALFDQPKGD